MAKRRHLCDVPGCTRERRRWQRICETCWRLLPGDVRTAIREHYRAARRPEHRAACKAAAEHIADAGRRAAERSRAAFERSEQLLGERTGSASSFPVGPIGRNA